MKLLPDLFSCTTFNSRVIWPPELEGHDLFTYKLEERGAGLWNSFKDRLLPLVHSQFTEEVMRHVEATGA